jgi:hypothetical protein
MEFLGYLFDLTSSTVKQDDPKYVDALSLSPVGSFSQEQFENDNNALNNSLYAELGESKRNGLEATKAFVNKFNQNYTKNFLILSIDDTAADKLMKGEYSDYVDLFDGSSNPKQDPKNAVLIELRNDKAIIHAIFLDVTGK